jgi:hypothetical protein
VALTAAKAVSGRLVRPYTASVVAAMVKQNAGVGRITATP